MTPAIDEPKLVPRAYAARSSIVDAMQQPYTTFSMVPYSVFRCFLSYFLLIGTVPSALKVAIKGYDHSSNPDVDISYRQDHRLMTTFLPG